MTADTKEPQISVPPPGQTRDYPKPTSTGSIPFEYAKNNLVAETAYYIWGDLKSSDRKPLICLHGGPGVPHNYLLPLALIYADYGIPVLMYDQVGCGKSTHFQDKKFDGNFWTPEMFLAELDNVKRYFGIEQFDLLGQSWGGMLAGQYAITQPKGLRKLIIEGGPSDIPAYAKVSQRLRSQLPKHVQEVLDRCEREGDTDSQEYKDATNYYYALHLCRVQPFPKELTDSFAQLEEDSTVYETMMGPNEFNATGTLKDWSITDELHKITERTVPGGLLIMNGHYDTVADETTSPFFYRPSCKVKWVRYALSSHCPILEETERLLGDLGRFLTSE